MAYALSAHEARFLWLVNLFLFFNWLGDSLDGTLARVRNRQRPRYGFYVDHIADTFGALALMAGLGLSGFLHWKIAAGMLVCFYVLSIESYLATYTTGRFQLSDGLFGPTEIRILLAAGKRLGYRTSLCESGRPASSIIKFRGPGRDCRNGGYGLVGGRSANRPPLPGGKPAMTSTKRRFGLFSAVGILGAGLQLLLQSLLTRGLDFPSVTATPVAVEIAILHNFLWARAVHLER